jgi:hypothetical protein
MMSNRLSLRYQLLSAHCGVGFALLYAIFWVGFGHNLPPMASPDLNASALAAVYAQNRQSILFGDSMAALVGVLWIPWTAQLAVAIKRIEGEASVLTYINLLGGALTAWVVVFVPAIWVTAAFRDDMPPDIVRAINDLGFILFNLTYAGTSLQAFAAGAAGFADPRAKKLFPRWVNWWAILTGLSFVPITAMPFFKTGPFAWNGLVTFWIGFLTFFVWCCSMGICMAREAKGLLRQAA